MTKNVARNEHITPRVVLRGFANDKEQVWTFDLKAQKKFQTAIKNVGSERDYYSINTSKGRVSMEEFFHQFEDNFRPIRDKIIREKSFSSLSSGEMAWLQGFAAIQFLRSRQLRAMDEKLVQQLVNMILEIKFNKKRDEKTIRINPDWLKAGQNIRLMKSFEDYSILLDIKDILLFETKGQEFLLGDGVLVLMNENDMAPYGNIGFAVPGIQIYFPLSPNFTLAFWCPSILEKYRESLKKFKNTQASILLNPELAPHINQEMKKELKKGRAQGRPIQRIIENHKNQNAIQCDLENVKYLNFLQVSQAFRQVFSSSGNFWMLEEILKGQAEGKISKGPILKTN